MLTKLWIDTSSKVWNRCSGST